MTLQGLIVEAEAFDLQLARAKYSRASYLFPTKQPATYQSFAEEVALLRSLLGHPLGSTGTAHVLGEPSTGLQWHVFTAAHSDFSSAKAANVVPVRTGSALSAASADSQQSSSSDVVFDDDCARFTGRHVDTAPPSAATHLPALTTLEVCMTELSEGAAAQFVRGDAFVSSAHTTEATGIQALVPAAKIDDYLFEPCGCASARLSWLVQGSMLVVLVDTCVPTHC